MKTEAPSLAVLAQEMADVQAGKVAPGRVWIVTRRPDGTVVRRQTSRVLFKRRRAAEAATEDTALPARRAMGVSQDRFAALLGISPATVRNIEQRRTKPAGPTAKLLSIAEQYPQIFVSSAKRSLAKVRATLDKAVTMDGSVKFSARRAKAENRQDERTRRKLKPREVQAPARTKAHTDHPTQAEAVTAARQLGHQPLTTRARNTNKGKPDHWRHA